MFWSIPTLAQAPWLNQIAGTQTLLTAGIVVLLFGPALVWCERWARGSSGIASTRVLLFGLAAMLASFMAVAATEPGLNATNTPHEFKAALCGLGLSYWQSLRAGAAVQQARFATGGSRWSANWLLGSVAFSPLGGLLPAFAILLVVAARGHQSAQRETPA